MGRILLVVGATVFLIVLFFGVGWWFIGTPFVGDYVRTKVQQTMEARLGRKVTIGRVIIVTHGVQQIVLDDVRIANAPGGVHPYFATVKRIVITGGIDSFWQRNVHVGRIDIVQPQIFFEVFPSGMALQHNFPQWQSPPPSKYQIYHLELNRMYVRGGLFDMLDRRHNVSLTAMDLASDITVTSKQNVYAGTAVSPLVHLRIQDYVPFDLDLRGGFRYTPNALALQSIAMRGPGMELFIAGNLSPLADAVYNLHVTSRMRAERVKQIFKIQKTLSGLLAIDAMLRGKASDFRLKGGWVSPRLRADVYELTNARGNLDLTGDRALVDVVRASYGGGTLTAHYTLPGYSEPYPMSVDLHYDRVSLEKLFEDWTIHDTGLRGAATGRLVYHWNKDQVLAGAGEGTATLSRATTAFSNAKYPIPLGGSANFALDNGVVTFRPANLDTGLSKIALEGKLRIADARTDLRMRIDSTDFSELDRLGYNFAHSAGKKTYTLLGLGGAGQITVSIVGPIKTPQVVAHIVSTGTKYNNDLLGDADIDLKYDGNKSVLMFERANFREGNGRLALTGTVTFPERGPSPLFDLAVEAVNYPIDRAMAAVNLKLKATGLGTGKMVISGSPDEGTVRFANLFVRKGASELTLNGETSWKPGKGNVVLNLDIAAKKFPVADIVAFLDLGTLPVSGDLTGKLHLQGPKSRLEGAGAITVENGAISGEPVTKATANIAFTAGTMKATNVTVTSPAGTVTGEAQLNLENNQFSYNIESGSIDLSKIKALSAIAGLLGGRLVLTSTGAGTFEHPEVVLQATLNEATLKGMSLPPGTPAPSIYFAIHGGQLIVKGSIGDVVTIDGNGTVGTDMSVNGAVRIAVTDVAKLLSYFPQTASFPAAGAITIDLKLGGELSSLEAFRIDGTVPVFKLDVSGHEFTPGGPLAFGLRDGRLVFDSFTLRHENTTLGITGFAELTGGKRVNIDLNGTIEAALLQLFMPGARAGGDIIVSGGIHGTLSDPHLAGTAEIQDAQFRFAGFPQVFDHVTGTIVFRPDRIDLDALHANVGGGTVVAGGTIAVEGMSPKNLRLSVQGTDVAVRYFEGVTVEGDFTLLLNGDLERMMLSGDVDVHRALYFKDFDFTQSLLNVVLSRRGVTPIVAANWQDHVGLRIHLKAPDTLAVRNNIADVTATADIDLTGTLANPVVLGSVALDEGGRVRINNVDYQVVRGSITFQNPFRIDPYFDVTIEGRVSGGFSEVESGPIDVTVNITGTLDRISPTITSDPPASDITLFSLLGFGGLTNKTGTAPATNLDAATAGKGLLLQSLTGYFGSKVLPFGGAFTYDPGFLDTSSDPGQKVTFEKRISNNLRVLVVHNLESHKNRELIEWQATPEWTLQFTRDTVNSEYRLEGRFRRRYLGHWTFGGLGRNPIALFARSVPIEPPAGIVEDRAAEAAKAEQVANAPPPPATNPTIVQINYRADARFDTTLLSRYVTLKVGQPLSIRETQSSIKSLFATGDFRDVRVESTPQAGGVAITFVLSLDYRVGSITFDGLHGPDRDHANRELTIHTGDVLSLNAVDHSASAIEDYLHRNGCLEATVDPETNFIRERSLANVTFHVVTGPLAKVGAVAFEGNVAPFNPAALVNPMREKTGATYKVQDARSDVDRIRTFLVRQEYRKAEVRFLNSAYDRPSHTVALRYHVDVGPIVRVEVVGVPRSAVRGLLPFRKNQPYSEDAIDRAADDIVRTYQERGYFNATVDTDGKLAGDNAWVTTFHVNPGQRYHLTTVTFSGNRNIPDKKLATLVSTSPSGGFHSLLSTIFRRPTGITRAQLSADRDALESYYRLQGFSDAKVATPVVNTKNDGTMTVDFPITEGVQTLLTDVHVEGNEQVAAKSLPKLQLKAGDPLNPQLVRVDQIALQSFYADRGNAEVQISPRIDVTPDHSRAKLAWVIAEGPKERVGQIIVRGNTYTDTNVILRKAELRTGEPFSYTTLLEAQRNLYRLGIFQRVDIQPEQAGTATSDRNLVISVEEGKDVTLSGSLGGSSTNASLDNGVKPIESVSLANRNLFGTGRYLGLELVHSPQRKEVFLTEIEPFLGNHDVPVQFTVFQNDDILRDAHIRERGSYIDLSKVSRFQTRWSVRYQYKIADCLVRKVGDLCDLLQRSLVPGAPPSIGNIRISSLTPTFFWDKRDDPVDPHRGFLTSASVEEAFRAFSAEANFTKEFAQAAWYHPITDRSVFAIGARFGLIQPRGGQEVPLSERFTAGGDSSHRAFALDLLGTVCVDPRDIHNGVCRPTLLSIGGANGEVLAPLGGNGLALINLEYRYPIFSAVGGQVFFDAGNVYAESAIRINDLRYGIGTGLRYMSPVGPIRFDIGYKLKRHIIAFDSDGKPIYEKPFAYFITLGYAF